MKNHLLASAVLASLALPLGAKADEPPPPLTGNFGVFSNYIFRGVSQTSERPAIQGGFDYAHQSGAYVGVWGSNVSWLSDTLAYSATSLEMDLYGGYKGTIGKTDFGYDVGGIYYYYPGKRNGAVNADTAEVYGAVSWKWLTAKLSYVLGDYFGVRNAEGTLYADLSASYPIGKSGVTLLAHVGSLKWAGTGNSVNDYTDWRVGATYALPKDYVVGADYASTNINSTVNFYSPAGVNWEKNQFSVYIKKTF